MTTRLDRAPPASSRSSATMASTLTSEFHAKPFYGGKAHCITDRGLSTHRRRRREAQGTVERHHLRHLPAQQGGEDLRGREADDAAAEVGRPHRVAGRVRIPASLASRDGRTVGGRHQPRHRRQAMARGQTTRGSQSSRSRRDLLAGQGRPMAMKFDELSWTLNDLQHFQESAGNWVYKNPLAKRLAKS